MKLKLKEDPKEWRKAAMLSSLGLAILSSVLCWRRILVVPVWATVLAILAGVVVSAFLWPHRFRGYYRASSRLGFVISQFIGHVVLGILFLLVLTPLGIALRLAGKDLLRLARPRDAGTYWTPTKETAPLDRLF
jgi:hypothetical protein